MSDAIPTEVLTEPYPATTVGTLMRQRDDCRSAATSARALADQYAALAEQNDARASQFQDAIDALGGEPS